MRNYEFVCWLEGYFDLCPDDAIDTKKARIIRNHLNLVRTVEGELGALNGEIYNYVSRALEGSISISELHIKLRDMLDNFLTKEFAS